jgi:enoyl-CoA hydratase/carnithine racemase
VNIPLHHVSYLFNGRNVTGRNFSAEEASSWGLISRVVPDGEGEEKGHGVLKEAIKMGELISEKPELAIRLAKESVDAGESLACIMFYVLMITFVLKDMS